LPPKQGKSKMEIEIGFFGILALIFITAKLFNKIKWPWIWVLIPIWGPISFSIFIVIVYIIGATIIAG
jgi:hypothetical protein